MSYCSKCGAYLEGENVQFCTGCGAKVETSTVSKVTPAEPIVQQSMKWFKFLIYFVLFFSAFINFVYGMNYMTGTIYFSQSNGQVTSQMVYSVYGNGLKALDIIYGIVLLVIAGFGIYTKFRLSKYKINAPQCVYILYGAGVALSLIYNIGLFVVTGINQIFAPSTVSSFIASVVMIVLNYKYFTKRKSLFNN